MKSYKMEIMFSVRKKEQETMIDSHNNVEKNEDNASFSSFYEEEDDEISSNSMDSSSSSDITEDASSSSSSFEMSSLISQLPLKRGLSKHYEGKSQSFTSLSSVKSLEDLVKPGKSSTRKKQLKESKSFVWNFDKSKVIKKKSSKGTLSSLSNMRNQGSSLERSRGASLSKSSCLLQGIWRPLVEN